MEYSVILLAAGRGERTHLEYNKVFYTLNNGKTVLDTGLDVFLNDPDCRQVVLVCSAYDWKAITKKYSKNERIVLCQGGATRQESVDKGLQKVTYPYVFIHDAARPYIQFKEIKALKQTLETEDACLLMVPSADTIKIVEDGYVKTTPIRSSCYCAQTPQCFKTELIKRCSAQAQQDGFSATDDAQVVEQYSDVPIKVVIGDITNLKITLPIDLV
ncbi:2-C-methyl-D-erythritol 4-phosphate cytidylyltransferase [Catenisphaera adipataccumulans]|jgi:2-C-methyl-D-erythritol 4-phosphate cytidylyltransferase|uniref:2-C-methyl-D-erythritol 4-phosphate cytidylyltransferase n=1 Tax=Catenisphaera adipataccumulans TaxID=700500 RepID=A0A7W8CY25_9FIRM|nr:2-C-methyl-D-erythritol 4-phosphate cytidylyltransferase [Catenisphaera adipataccumulans]MBB5182524.1 2-C-methyl-D-erythritol 4-phosphate cytidylyltransferase [Catenisphaera adipataccumulans]